MFVMDERKTAMTKTKPKIQNRSTKDDQVVTDIPAACANEQAAVEFLERQRWGDHPCCPRCGSMGVYQMRDSETGGRQKNYRWRCHDCRSVNNKEQFTVRTGTVFEESRIDLRHWCYAFWRTSTSKKGVSALEIHRQTGLSYKSALFLLHRIRHAMADSPFAKLGGEGKIIEADETFFGNKEGVEKRRGYAHKHAIFALVERKGAVRSFHVPNVTAKTLKPIMEAQMAKEAHLMTDDAGQYRILGPVSASHETVAHSHKEYVRGNVHTNTIEGFFSIVKRGLNGIYHNVSEAHLHRYLAEFDFRYTNRELSDGERTTLAIRSANGKRLTYKPLIAKS